MEKQELIELINTVLDSREPKALPQIGPDAPMRSEKTGKVRAALSKMKASYRTVTADKTNPLFKSKYADVNDVLDMISPLLSEFGLSLDQEEEFYQDERYLRTVLQHNETEQFISSYTKMIQDKQNVQGYGSSLTYHRRYSICCLLGISIDKDDDGNAATNEQKQQFKKQQTQPVKKQQPQYAKTKQNQQSTDNNEPLLSKAQVDIIDSMLTNKPRYKVEILKMLKRDRLHDCPAKWFNIIIQAIEKLKKEAE
jgi:hypothetical protein